MKLPQFKLKTLMLMTAFIACVVFASQHAVVQFAWRPDTGKDGGSNHLYVGWKGEHDPMTILDVGYFNSKSNNGSMRYWIVVFGWDIHEPRAGFEPLAATYNRFMGKFR